MELTEQYVESMTAALRHLSESLLTFDNFVNPCDDLIDPDGTHWQPIGCQDPRQEKPFTTEAELSSIRQATRRLAEKNEFAIGAHQNRVNYVVGSGHIYTAVPKKGEPPPEDLPARVQAVLDDFIDRNKWHKRQQEIVRRNDRDGEVFLRFFGGADGEVNIRFVEPMNVKTPANMAHNESASFGILTEPDDVETVLLYFINGEHVEPDEIQHRKSNADMTLKRGVPLFYPARPNLIRADKMLRNMATVTEIQSAIAMIRKHVSATSQGLQTFANAKADATVTNPRTGKTTTFQHYAPGTILDVNAGVEHEFPAIKVDPSKPVAAIQASLRAVAAMVVMPEFMFTADASNANFASTLVAEGPAIKNFERLQADQIEEDLEVMDRVVQAKIDVGALPPNTLQLVEIQVEAPKLAVRDNLKEAQTDQVLSGGSILSPQTWAARNNLDYEQEQENIDKDRERSGSSLVPPGQRQLPAGFLDNQGADDQENDDA